MISVSVIFKEPAWPDLAERKDVAHITSGQPLQVAVLDGGMLSGRPSLALPINLPDGQVAILETSARAFCAAARAIKGRYPDLED